MTSRRFLALARFSCIALLLSEARAQTRTYSFDIVQQNSIPASLLPFQAQDLVAARLEPTGNMPVYAWYVRKQFHDKNGRDPSTDLEIAAAVVDWVSSNLRHPYFYPQDPSLPRFYQNQAGDPKYATLNLDPVRILNYTLLHDPSDPVTWPSPLCTYQNAAAAGLLNYFGLHARLVDVEGHTGLEYFSFEHHRWIWMDATFNEHYVRVNPDGSTFPLGVRELNSLTLAGRLSAVTVVKHGYPSADYAEDVYLSAHPRGFRQYAPTTYMQIYGGAGVGLSRFSTFEYSPPVPADYTPLPGEIDNFETSPSSGGWFYWPKVSDPVLLDYPLDGIALAGPISWDTDALIVTLRSYLPFTTAFEVYQPAQQAWVPVQTVTAPAYAPARSEPLRFGWGTGLVQVRGRDGRGNVTQAFIVRVY